MKLHKVLLLLGASSLLLTACVDEGADVEEADIEEVTESEELLEEEGTEEEAAEEVETETESETNSLSEEIEGLHVTEVREDTTGNWYKTVDSKDFNMPENAIDYYNEYMEDDEIHYLVSFATNTTTMINNLGGTLYVDVTEYVDREEHSSDTIGGGMLLKSYQVNLESGEITEVE